VTPWLLHAVSATQLASCSILRLHGTFPTKSLAAETMIQLRSQTPRGHHLDDTLRSPWSYCLIVLRLLSNVGINKACCSDPITSKPGLAVMISV
jgi:hypothetical protein